MPEAAYLVGGMTCEHCVRAVTSELGRLPGVRGVRVKLNSGGESLVEVTSDQTLAAEAVVAALDEAGGYSLA
jgi:copper chaperone